MSSCRSSPHAQPGLLTASSLIASRLRTSSSALVTISLGSDRPQRADDLFKSLALRAVLHLLGRPLA
jgi:hypothetical protein